MAKNTVIYNGFAHLRQNKVPKRRFWAELAPSGPMMFFVLLLFLTVAVVVAVLVTAAAVVDTNSDTVTYIDSDVRQCHRHRL